MPTQSNGSHAENHHTTSTPGSNGNRPLGTPTLPLDNAPSDADFDALAELFLDPPEKHHTTADTERHTTPTAARRLPIGALILGHLPVMASAWPAQHARMRAEETGKPVVIARLSRGVLTLEAIGAPPSIPTFRDQSQALEWTATHAESALLRVDEADETELASIPKIDRLIILTGADDAAVVACYRKLKNVAAEATAERPLPATQLTIVGTGAAKGKLAHERIARAARTFLEADLLEPVVVDRIAPTQSHVLFSGPTTLTPRALIDALHNPAAEPTPAREIHTPTNTEPEPMPSARAPAAPLEPATPTAPAPPVESFPTQPPPVPAAPSPRTATIAYADEPTPDQSNTHGPLARLVPGLLPLETTCPAAPEVTLAYDATGSLHLLAASLTQLPQLSTDTPVRSLLRANAWARSHATILSRVEPRLAEAAATHTEMHLITDRAEEARAVLDTPIHVHLAAPAAPATHGLVTVSLDR